MPAATDLIGIPRIVRVFAAVATVMVVAGCASLPTDKLGAHSQALPARDDAALVRIVARSRPDPELTGFRLMPGGDFALDTRLQLIRRAEHSLDLQYYQIENDSTGRYLLRALRDAAAHGVRVRLLLDDLYTAGDDALLLTLAAHERVEVRLFNPFAAGRDSLTTRLASALFDVKRVNRRMHNKLLIADGSMAVAGGRNIGDRYFRRSEQENFIDLDTFVAGAAVPRLAALFDRYWNSEHVFPVQAVATDDRSPAARRERFDALTAADSPPAAPSPNDLLGYGPLRDELDAGRLGLIWTFAEAYADSPDRVDGATTSYGGVPLLDVTSVRYNVVEQIRRARAEVVIASPYLIPGEAGLQVLSEARGRGVAIDIVTSSLAATDEPLVHTGYRRYRREMLALGVEVYELSSTQARTSVRIGVFGSRIGRLHLKTAVADRRMVYIGSMNFDPRSKFHNTELGLIIDSPEIAEQVLKLIELLKLEGSYRVHIDPTTDQLRWSDAEGQRTLDVEPDSPWWQRLLLELLAPLTPEHLL
jgi:putative cardiolipin synthase